MNDPERDNLFGKQGGSINMLMLGVKALGVTVTTIFLLGMAYFLWW